MTVFFFFSVLIRVLFLIFYPLLVAYSLQYIYSTTSLSQTYMCSDQSDFDYFPSLIESSPKTPQNLHKHKINDKIGLKIHKAFHE